MSASEPRAPFRSGRLSREAAGWHCQKPADLTTVVDKKDLVRFRWIGLDPRPLVQSRNDRLARWLGDPIVGIRRGWVEAMNARHGGGPDGLRLRRFEKEEAVSFIVLGDTGEGDRSQYHVVRPLKRICAAEQADFMFIVSDVIYPAGDIHQYKLKFYKPYSWFHGPIYAVPGNHDWYDGLEGFMRHFCGARKEECPPAKPVGKRWQQAVRWATWRRSAKPDEGEIAKMQALRGAPEQQANQPGPYFAMDAGPVLLVGLDTGIEALVDAEQGTWLKNVSKLPKPKILLTGKPLYVNGVCGGTGEDKKDPIMVEGVGEEPDVPLLSIVNDPAHDYVAVIGGDIHNYQRYQVTFPDGRTIQHLISGAGGAYTHATHTIPKVNLPGCKEEDFRAYPLRGDSLAVYSILYDKRFGEWWRRLRRNVSYIVPYEQAPKIMSEMRDIPTTRPQDAKVVVTPEARKAADRVFGQPDRLSGVLHTHFSEFLDWDEPEPPLFKSMIRLDITASEIEIRCFGATGCEEHADDPLLEDWVIGSRGEGGRYTWIDKLAELAGKPDPGGQA